MNKYYDWLVLFLGFVLGIATTLVYQFAVYVFSNAN